MEFSSQQIEFAVAFKQRGLPWEPAVGNYVYDTHRVLPASSPFQDGVYFLLNYECFMQRTGGIERFKEVMTWLPTWCDARRILRSLGVTDEQVQASLFYTQAFERGTELLQLYELIATHLPAQHEASLNDHNRTCNA